MKNAIILHGMPTKDNYYDPNRPSQSNSHWLPWLAQQLIVRDIYAVTPEIPKAFETVWERWLKEVERFDIGKDTILVGHSCGGGFWLRYLSERPDLKVDKVVLVAPSHGLSWEETDRKAMFGDFKLDPELASRTNGIIIFNSTDDKPGIQHAVSEIRSTIKNVKYREFEGLGHFTEASMGKRDFPELLEELTS